MQNHPGCGGHVALLQSNHDFMAIHPLCHCVDSINSHMLIWVALSE